MKTYNNIFANKNRILFVTAHPDDVDIFFGGTLRLLNNDGKETFVCVVSSGARGSRGNPVSEEVLTKTRKVEQLNGLKILGTKKDHFISLNYKDGEVENNLELISKISKIIREFRPDIVCTHEPHNYYFNFNGSGEHLVNHRDHRMTGISTLDAIYPFSRDRSFFPEQLKNKETHTIKEVLFIGENEPNVKIDASSVIREKRSAMLAHKSQINEEIAERLLKYFRKNGQHFEHARHIAIA